MNIEKNWIKYNLEEHIPDVEDYLSNSKTLTDESLWRLKKIISQKIYGDVKLSENLQDELNQTQDAIRILATNASGKHKALRILRALYDKYKNTNNNQIRSIINQMDILMPDVEAIFANLESQVGKHGGVDLGITAFLMYVASVIESGIINSAKIVSRTVIGILALGAFILFVIKVRKWTQPAKPEITLPPLRYLDENIKVNAMSVNILPTIIGNIQNGFSQLLVPMLTNILALAHSGGMKEMLLITYKITDYIYLKNPPGEIGEFQRNLTDLIIILGKLQNSDLSSFASMGAGQFLNLSIDVSTDRILLLYDAAFVLQKMEPFISSGKLGQHISDMVAVLKGKKIKTAQDFLAMVPGYMIENLEFSLGKINNILEELAPPIAAMGEVSKKFTNLKAAFSGEPHEFSADSFASPVNFLTFRKILHDWENVSDANKAIFVQYIKILHNTTFYEHGREGNKNLWAFLTYLNNRISEIGTQLQQKKNIGYIEMGVSGKSATDSLFRLMELINIDFTAPVFFITNAENTLALRYFPVDNSVGYVPTVGLNHRDPLNLWMFGTDRKFIYNLGVKGSLYGYIPSHKIIGQPYAMVNSTNAPDEYSKIRFETPPDPVNSNKYVSRLVCFYDESEKWKDVPYIMYYNPTVQQTSILGNEPPAGAGTQWMIQYFNTIQPPVPLPSVSPVLIRPDPVAVSSAAPSQNFLIKNVATNCYISHVKGDAGEYIATVPEGAVSPGKVIMSANNNNAILNRTTDGWRTITDYHKWMSGHYPVLSSSNADVNLYKLVKKQDKFNIKNSEGWYLFVDPNVGCGPSGITTAYHASDDAPELITNAYLWDKISAPALGGNPYAVLGGCLVCSPKLALFAGLVLLLVLVLIYLCCVCYKKYYAVPITWPVSSPV
jgi:hypothetical protein